MRRRAALAKTLKGMHHKADGGPVPTDAQMDRAKKVIRNLDTLQKGTWSGRSALDYAAKDTQSMADSIRKQRD